MMPLRETTNIHNNTKLEGGGVKSSSGASLFDETDLESIDNMRTDKLKLAASSFTNKSFRLGDDESEAEIRATTKTFLESAQIRHVEKMSEQPAARMIYKKIFAISAAANANMAPGRSDFSKWKKGPLNYLKALRELAGNTGAYQRLFPAMTEDEAAAAAAAAAEQLESTARDMGLEVDDLKTMLEDHEKRLAHVEKRVDNEGRVDHVEEVLKEQGEENESTKARLKRHSESISESKAKEQRLEEQHKIAVMQRLRTSLRAKQCLEARAALQWRRSERQMREVAELKERQTREVAELKAENAALAAALAAALEREKVAREAALEREKAAREADISVLESTIDAEKAARERDIEDDQDALAAETAARQDALAAEAAARQEGDAAEAAARDASLQQAKERLEKLGEIQRANALQNFKFLRGQPRRERLESEQSLMNELSALRGELSARVSGVSQGGQRRAAKSDAKSDAKLEALEAKIAESEAAAEARIRAVKAQLATELLPAAVERGLLAAEERAAKLDAANRTDTLECLKLLRNATKEENEKHKADILTQLAARVAGVSEGSIRRDARLEKLFHTLLSAERSLTRADKVQVTTAINDMGERMAEIEALMPEAVIDRFDLD